MILQYDIIVSVFYLSSDFMHFHYCPIQSHCYN